jgi:hypothetical protein
MEDAPERLHFGTYVQYRTETAVEKMRHKVKKLDLPISRSSSGAQSRQLPSSKFQRL